MKSRSLHRPCRAAALQVWLALCLLLAQGLGQGHRVAHLGFKLSATAAEQGAPDAWGHALGSADCQLFDHLAHGDQLGTAAPLNALLTLSVALSTTAVPASAEAWPAAPRARGPPLLA